MNYEGPSNDVPPPIKALMERVRKEQATAQLVNQIQSRHSSETENKVLMSLWAKLGDHTETYWEAMQAVSAFVSAFKSTREAVDKNFPATRVLLYRALAEILLIEANSEEETAKAVEQFNSNPQP